ncbi:hypothetical protein HYPSUDRAFT_44609 [Hypholoma sublateritium FD-334 SS-4]|uniref:DUF6593 domain-containing protein n=1 Tax=Hypholoma sublateritium (strain FD-334 SS-4) TaxID=945553 RepID=A0A0D2PGC5_HYPSF|nr:hypothetical protein HYPSUDRAFT_44609 [Hypholoma sublateritium FD-334 SS-4]
MNLEPRASTTSQDEQLSSWEGPPTVDDYQRLSADTEADAGLAKIAEIELHTISSTIIRHLGNEWKTSDFFRKEDWSWYGSDRIFKGVDGKEYKWKMGSTVCELFLIDGDPKEEHGKAHVLLLVARFNAQSSPMQAPSSLEIFPAGSDMEDWILITFVYIELLRNGRRLGLSKPQAIAARASEEQSPNNSSDKHRHTNTPWLLLT